MQILGEEKFNTKFNEQFSDKYTSISIEKMLINSEIERLCYRYRKATLIKLCLQLLYGK